MSARSATIPTIVTARRRHEDVVVLDVRQLVGEHPSSSTRFIFSSSPVVTATAACWGCGRWRRRWAPCPAPRRCAGLGQSAGDAEALDEVVQPGVLHRVGRMGPAHRQGDPVGLPVGPERGAAGDDRRDRRGRRTRRRTRSIAPTTRTTKSDEPGDQQEGAALVGGDLVVHGPAVFRTGPGRPREVVVGLEVLPLAKPIRPAMMTVGNDWIFVLYLLTVSL